MSLVVARKPAVLITAHGAEQHAVAVDDEDPPVGGERAEDLGRPEPAGDAIERDRGARRLIEAHVLADADVERAPVDDRARGRLVDDDGGAALALDRGRAAHDVGAVGPGRCWRPAEHRQRRGGKKEGAQAWQAHHSHTATAES
jgi:hypothetical protein